MFDFGFITLLSILAALFLLGKIIIEVLRKSGRRIDLSVYERKPYLFDSNSEFNLYKLLFELFGNQYHIFPQVNYSHLIRPKKTYWVDERKYRSRIDRKSADFVLCDKIYVIPQLIIELDGPTHSLESRQRRDEFINELAKIVGLPILHLKTDNFDKGFIKNEINKKLGIT